MDFYEVITTTSEKRCHLLRNLPIFHLGLVIFLFVYGTDIKSYEQYIYLNLTESRALYVKTRIQFI